MVATIRNRVSVLAISLALFPLARALAAPACHGFLATNVAFGNYDPITAAPLTSQGSISYNCPPPTTASVTINRGGSSTYQPRAMSQPGVPDRLQYNLYIDPGFTTVFGDGTEGTSGLALPSTHGTQTLAIYALLFPNQDIPAGTYTDALIVTFNF
jgi:spore coat protein U-like protein